jgi:hypothetical protein
MPPSVDAGDKWCRECDTIKPLEAFARHAKMPDGRQSYCRECFARRYRTKQQAAGKVVAPPDIPAQHKFCRGCQQVLPLSRWSQRARTTDGYATRCRECTSARDRERALEAKYGMTSAAVDDMRESQGGLCAICKAAPAAHVDHDHATGTVRGMLCFPCNAAIGHLRDDPQVVRQAAVYLDKARRAADRTWLQELLDSDQTSRLERAFAAVLVAHQNAT